MRISLCCKRIGQKDFEEIRFRPGEYFEPLDEDRPFEWDDVPEYLHAVGYLPIPAREVSETLLRISEAERPLLQIDEVLWNSGKNVFLRSDDDALDLIVVGEGRKLGGRGAPR
ncbi:MAG TPA: hypothetical protein VHO06_20695 [Polyangia bacterium]|nr:hypothetical protein [Polyangia bacterium]